MKTEFPILNISPTQWVLVDKSRKAVKGEQYASYATGIKGVGAGWSIYTHKGDNRSIVGSLCVDAHPILAAYPKIEGVLLLPSTLWEKKKNPLNVETDVNLFNRTFGPRRGKFTADQWHFLQSGFIAACSIKNETAGGYNREDMRKAFDWGATLQGADETLDEKEFDAFLSELKSPSPRALEIEVGEDGSLPSENGTIIYNKAIY